MFPELPKSLNAVKKTERERETTETTDATNE